MADSRYLFDAFGERCAWRRHARRRAGLRAGNETVTLFPLDGPHGITPACLPWYPASWRAATGPPRDCDQTTKGASMIDKSAFNALSYGLYLITSREGERKVGCVANTFQQVTATPPRVSVALNKENATAQAVRETGRFAATVLGQGATMDLIGAFGFRSSREFDKFATCAHELDAAEIPYVTSQGVARFSVRVEQVIDVGTHLLFVGEVEEAACLADAEPMTYAYYHTVLRGKTPPKASSYQGDAAPAEAAPAEPAAERWGWQCTLCGYIEEDYPDGLPEDYACPICGVGREMFERVRL